MRGAGEGSGVLGYDAEGGLPKSAGAAAFAETEDAFVGGADVGFDAGVVDLFEGLAMAANEGEKPQLPFRGSDGRKVDVPEIEVGIEEGDAVGVLAVLRAELADDTDFGFLVLIGPAEEELLFGGELVAGEDAGAVKAEEDGIGGLGKDFAIQVAPDEEDGDFFRDASAAAHNQWWQAGGQREGRGRTF